MATERDEQVKLTSSVNSGMSYGTNSSNTLEVSNVENNPIKQLWREISSGRQRLYVVLLYSIFVAFGSCITGFVLGFSSLLNINMEKYHFPARHLPNDQQTQFVGSVATMGAFFAGLLVGIVSDKIGRKATLLLLTIPSVIGWYFIAASFWFSVDNDYRKYLAMLLAGRCLSGFAAGGFSLVVPVYIIEISPSSLKGLFGSINQLAVTIGILLIYVMLTIIPYYIVALMVMGFTVVFAIVVCFVPETPRWLIANKQHLLANAILHRLRGPKANISREMKLLEDAVEEQGKVEFMEKLRMLTKLTIVVPLILSISLMFFQQFCGINVVVFYAGNVLEKANLSPNEAALAADFGVGVIQVIFTFISVLLIDLVGRKILLSVGGVLLALSTGILGLYFFLTDHMCHRDSSMFYCDHNFGYLAVACLAIFIIGFSIGWGPIPWVMMGELAPLQVRGILSGISTAVNWSLATVITSAFSRYEEAVHPYGAWWSFCFISALSVVFVIVFLPETKGKDLEEIEAYFKKRYGLKTRPEPVDELTNNYH